MIPLMGFCYLLQYMDKLALSSSTLLGLLQDLVREMDIVTIERTRASFSVSYLVGHMR